MSARLAASVTAVALAVAWLAVVLTLAAPVARAQEPPPTLDVRATFDTPSATLGQHARLTVTVRHPQSVLVTIARPPAQAALDVTVDGPATTQPDATGDLATTTASFVLAAFALGPVQLTPLHVSWLRADGSSGSVTVDAPVLTITAVRAAADDALRPLKPQITVPGGPPPWTRYAAVGGSAFVAALAVTLLAVWERRRRRRAAREHFVPPDVTPEVQARQRLDALLLPARNVSEHYQQFYGTISLAVREYLQSRFGFNATALTTTQLEQRMVARGVGRWQARLVGGLLDRCDAAVYAHDYPDPASADHDLTLAYEIVELSRPGAAADAEAAVLA